jgi:hypothetical protein
VEIFILIGALLCLGYASNKAHGINNDSQPIDFSDESVAERSNAGSPTWSLFDDDNTGLGSTSQSFSSTSMFDDSTSSTYDHHVNIWTDPSYSWMDGNLFHSDSASSIFDHDSSSSFDSFSSSSSSMSDW